MTGKRENPAPNVYARYLHDFNKGTDNVEVGHALSCDGAFERYPIARDNANLSESYFMIESVEMNGVNQIVTYDTRTRGRVREAFKPKAIVEQASIRQLRNGAVGFFAGD